MCQQDTLSIHQAVPHPHPVLHSLVILVEAMVMGQDMDMVTMDMDMVITDMDMDTMDMDMVTTVTTDTVTMDTVTTDTDVSMVTCVARSDSVW